MNKKILVIDPADHSGWCFVEIIKDVAHIKQWGFIDVEPADYTGDEYISFTSAIA